MGKLKFNILSIESLDNKNFHAIGRNPLKEKTFMVVGKWETSETTKAAKGFFTIIADHTS